MKKEKTHDVLYNGVERISSKECIMNLYSHLTIEERENILKYHTLKMTITQIANILGRNKSTISRELRRNSDLNGYSPSKATSRYLDRRKNCHPVLKVSDPGLFAYVKEKFLNEQWSPEQIQGRLKLENAQWSIARSIELFTLICLMSQG